MKRNKDLEVEGDEETREMNAWTSEIRSSLSLEISQKFYNFYLETRSKIRP